RRGHPEGHRIRAELADPRFCESSDWLTGGRGLLDDLVVDVGDVHHPCHVEALVAQIAHEQVRKEKRSEVADVRRAVDRWSARVDPDVARHQRRELVRPPGERVEKPQRHRLDSTTATAWAEMPRPAPSMPARLPVDALTLTASVCRPSSRAIAPRISSNRWPSRGRAATIVRSTSRGR